MTNGSLMKVQSIAECSPWSILQYFWPVLSDNWSWKPIFGLFESGRFTQVLLYLYEPAWDFDTYRIVEQWKAQASLCIRAFFARILHKVWMKMKTQTKI